MSTPMNRSTSEAKATNHAAKRVADSAADAFSALLAQMETLEKKLARLSDDAGKSVQHRRNCATPRRRLGGP